MHTLLRQVDEFGKFFVFHAKLFRYYFIPPYRVGLVLNQIDFIGFKSLGVVCLTALFTGLVMAIQLYYAFSQFGAEGLMGYTIFLSVGRELGPVFTALMVISRGISGMAAELGTMRVTEQIDAIDILSIDSKRYLVIPRVIATFLSLPLLILVFDMVANVSAYVLATQVLGVNGTIYTDTITQLVKFSDFGQGIIKGLIFGVAIAAIGSYMGYFASGGARGVGIATTKAVVVSAVSLLALNYFVSSILLAFNF